MGNELIKLINMNKSFKENSVIEDMNLDVGKGEFLTVLGPSGCGKTTTLRMIAGFEKPTSGEIILNGKNVENLPPNKRDINTVFQNYALFPHMTVEKNVGYGLRMKKEKKDVIKRKVSEVLQMVQMEKFADRKPRQLSGGQQQRVAIARALVNHPSILLLDEPLGALDLKLRKQMQLELKSLQKRLGTTFIYVTHDQEEALTMSDRIAVMNQGKIEQIDKPINIYNHPQTKFVADFIGQTNLLKGKVLSEKDGVATILIGKKIYTFKSSGNVEKDDQVYISIRPEQMIITRNEGNDELTGVITDRIFIGSSYKTIVQMTSGQTVMVEESVASSHLISKGDQVALAWHENKAILLA